MGQIEYIGLGYTELYRLVQKSYSNKVLWFASKLFILKVHGL